MQISQFLNQQHVEFDSLVHPPAFSAQRRASLLQISGRLVAKSVLLCSRDGYSLAILPATHRIDFDQLSEQIGSQFRLARDIEIAELFQDCEWGVVPPFGKLYSIPVLLDDSISSEDQLVFEGQDHLHAIRMRCEDFERLENPRRLQFGYLTNEDNA